VEFLFCGAFYNSLFYMILYYSESILGWGDANEDE